MATYSKFVADIGGTNARFALLDESTDKPTELRRVKVFECKNFETAGETIEAYKQYLGGDLPAQGCIAAAGPVYDGIVKFTNREWQLSKTELEHSMELQYLELMNDFTAVAYSVDNLEPDEMVTLHKASVTDGIKTAIGAGTGLGTVALVKSGRHPTIIESEGGHVRFAPSNELELNLLEYLMRSHDYVSAEHILAGPGIKTLYHALGDIYGVETDNLRPNDITIRAERHSDTHCVTTIKVYANILASYCAATALTYCAKGGIYLTGGIFRSVQSFLDTDEFRARYLQQHRMTGMVADTNLALVLLEDPGLQGAAQRAAQL